MDVCSVIKTRLQELRLEQKNLAGAGFDQIGELSAVDIELLA